MKKITILTLHLGYGGIEKCISTLSNSLINNYEINIISTYKLFDKPGFEFSNKVKITYLMENLKPNKNEFIQSIKQFNIPKILKEGFKSLKILYLKKKLMIKYIKKCDSDIIISTRDIHNKWLGKYGNKNSLKIGWEHNHPHGNKKYSKKIVESVDNLDYLVLVSMELKNYYSKLLENHKCKCIYIPNSIDYFPPRLSNKNKMNIISIGRLSQEKGYLDLIDVFYLIHQLNSCIHLNIIGDGPEKNKIIEKIEKYNLSNNVTLHGFQNKCYINKILEQSSIYLMCSHTESFGIVLLEAAAFGIPSIAFESAEGSRELIKNGLNGYLIKDRNKQEMANKVIDLLNNNNKLLVMGNNALKNCEKFNIENVKKEWRKIFDETK